MEKEMGSEKEQYRAILDAAKDLARAAWLVGYQVEWLESGTDRLSELRKAVALAAGAVVALERELSLAVELAQRRDIAPPEL
jgi:hypothetical protein